MADVSTQIKFLYGNKNGIQKQITDGVIEGSDLVITSDTSEMIFVDKAKNLKPIKSRTEEEYTVVGTSIGALNENDVIPEGITLDEFIEMICRKRVPATYVAPVVSLEETAEPINGTVYELGAVANFSGVSNFTKNDGGVLSSNCIKHNDTVLTSSAAYPLYVTNYDFIVNEPVETFHAEVAHAQGTVKLDNFEEPSPEGRIEAGTAISNKITVYGKRFMFFGTASGVAEFNNSDDVRALERSIPVGIKTITIEVPVGHQYIAFAIPAEIAVKQIRYEQANDDNMLPNFDVTTIAVEGANNYEAIDYNLYVYQMASTAEAEMKFIVTLV